MISIVLGTFNRLNNLKKSITSIVIASRKLSKPAEVIVLDGGSNSDTIQYLKKLSSNKHIILKVIYEGALHGVTRSYNRGFRLASYDFVTWTSDDCAYKENTLKVIVDRLQKENNNTLLSISIDVGDGRGFVNHGQNTPVGAGHRLLFEKVDYWSEDFVTYASDNDFCMKIHMSGGEIKPEPDAKIIHYINHKDDLHKKNLSVNDSSKRYNALYKGVILKEAKVKNRTYADIWIDASSAKELVNKLEHTKLTKGWCNYYTGNDFGISCLLESLNVTVETFKGKKNYNMMV